ncbi:MAG: glycosyltransferase [Flavobacteriaceae bacterium]
MKHKIAFFVINHTSIGGVERVNSGIISLFLKNELNVHSLISFAKKNVENTAISYPKELKFHSVNKDSLTIDLANYINTHRITHLIFQGDNMTISQDILNALKQTNCKGFLHYHGSPYAYLQKNYYWSDIIEKPITALKILAAKIVYPIKKNKLKRIINESSDGFVAVSNGVKKELNTIFKTNFNNVVSIHSPTSFNPKLTVDINQKEKNIVFTSRLVRKHKNAFLTLKVWKLLHEKYPDWKLQILGYGVILDQMNSYIKSHNLTNVKIFGYVNNIDDFLRKSAISMVTSDTEGFSMFAYESLVFKNPIVSTESYGGIWDMIKHDYNGLFSPRNDAEKMASNLELLMNDNDLRVEMGQHSYEKFLELQQEDIFKQWQTLLKLNDKLS